MGKVAWVLAILSIACAFICGQSAKNKIELERRANAKRLATLQQTVDELLVDGQKGIDKLAAKCAVFEKTAREVAEEKKLVETSHKDLTGAIASTAQSIDQLEAERDTAKTEKKQNLNEIKDMQESIVRLEKQIAVLKELMPMVKISEEDR